MGAARLAEQALKRDRVLVLGGLAGAVLLAWAYLFAAAAGMEAGMDLGAMGKAAGMPALRAWTPLEFALMLAMWAIMMVGMMLPGAAPMILLHLTFGRGQRAQGNSVASTAYFALGYVLVWSAFSLGATLLQWGLEAVALMSPMMVATSRILGGAILVAAGLYQLTPLKYACLKHCRSPLQFLMAHWRPGAKGAIRMGLAHGAFCVGCCWMLMALLFVGGVMNLVWIAAIAAFVLMEKLLPWGSGRAVSWVTGAALLAWGVWVIAAG